MRLRPRLLSTGLVLLVAAVAARQMTAGPVGGPTGDWTLIGWNDLGMHCMDSDYEVFSILPPFNTVVAQVVDANGDLVDLPAGTTVTYRGVADPSGSINLSSAGKTNFWDHVRDLFGVNLPVDSGLAGNDMPGEFNLEGTLHFDAGLGWFTAEGIPITPYDDNGAKNYYPMVRLEVRDPAGVSRATTDVVLPVSDEMDCRACHASGAGPQAQPAGGWVADSNFERDFRLNILRLHDERHAGEPEYTAALANYSYNASGLFETVNTDGRAILCATCHRSNALPGTGFGTISPLTTAVHAGHDDAIDPFTGMLLGNSENRASCYTCHPGSETRCLRGAMGAAVASDGLLSMQCQSCHGGMADVGSTAREGWFEEPACQSCHTGSATQNNGQIRYASVFEPDGSERVAVSSLFATNPDTPAAGLDLYRFSSGHGGLQCSACHGSTHAVYPSAHANDNEQSLALQGHVGTLVDCTACHASMPSTVNGGPHGLHPISADWIDDHGDVVEQSGAGQCAACHGTNYRGSVLARVQGDRSFNTDHGQFSFWRGSEVGCYTCHDGPDDDDPTGNTPPVVSNAQASTPAGVPVAVSLQVSDPNAGQTTTLRLVTQPAHGTVGLVGNQATYYPETGFAGSDAFTFAASDNWNDSNLGTVQINVTANWENYGEGHPGTNGAVPELSLAGVPSLGTGVLFRLGNTSPTSALTILLSGERPDYQPTPFGGRLLVQATGQRTFTLPPQGWNRTYHVPSNPNLIGRNVLFQTLVRDPAAAGGFAFSRGLRLVFGQ